MWVQSADRSDSFSHLIDNKVNSRIAGWEEKLLSIIGKKILIKSIAQAVPAYAMMVFKILKKNMQGNKECHLAILVG